MITETLRIVEAVLLDDIVGVNAQIDALVLDTPNGGTTPDPRPAHVTIRNEMDLDTTVRERDEVQFPLVLVELGMQTPSGAGQIWSGKRDYDLDIRLAYLIKSGDIVKNRRNTDYTLRAMVKSIAHGLLAAGTRDTAGRRNGYGVVKSDHLRYAHENQSNAGALMAGAVEFTLTMRDTNP